MTENSHPAAGGQQSPASSAQEFLDVLHDFQRNGTFPVEQKLLDELNRRQATNTLDYHTAREAIRSAMLKAGAPQMALDVVRDLFQPGDIVAICAIPPQGGPIARQGDPHDAKQAAELETFVGDQLGYANLYVGVCPRKSQLSGKCRRAKDADVRCRRHIALDLDNKDAPDFDAGWQRTIEALRRLSPAQVVHSGNGWQVWFNLVTLEGDALAESASKLDEALAVIGADSTGDLSRLMRLPYTLNLPNASKRRRGCVVHFAAPEEFITAKEIAT